MLMNYEGVFFHSGALDQQRLSTCPMVSVGGVCGVISEGEVAERPIRQGVQINLLSPINRTASCLLGTVSGQT